MIPLREAPHLHLPPPPPVPSHSASGRLQGGSKKLKWRAAERGEVTGHSKMR